MYQLRVFDKKGVRGYKRTRTKKVTSSEELIYPLYNIATTETKTVTMLTAIPRKEVEEWVTETPPELAALPLVAVLVAELPVVVGVVPGLVVVTLAELEEVDGEACGGIREEK
jgi:hypothetical protein